MKRSVGADNKTSKLSPIELLEAYSHYSKMAFRTVDEQTYLGNLRTEILKRMDGGDP